MYPDSRTEGPFRRLNPKILADLRLGRIAYDYRAQGKSITLLTFVAVQHAGALTKEERPILLYPNLPQAHFGERMWRDCFGAFDRPRFMSVNQHPDGLSGVIYTDEVGLLLPRRWQFALHPGLRYAGGVKSF